MLQLRAKCSPCAVSTPVVDEGLRRSAVVACDHERAGLARDGKDGSAVDVLKKMKGGRFIEREARNTVRSLKSDMQGKAAAVGVTNQVHLPVRAIDDRKRPCRLIGQRESVRAAPGVGGFAAVVF